MSTAGFEAASRRGGHGRKWRDVAPDVIPTCVAEMDFPAPEPIAARLADVVARRDFGYARPAARAELSALLAERLSRRHAVDVDPALVRVHAEALQPLQLALLARTQPGDGVLVHVPEYDGFRAAIEGCGRRVVTAPLARTGDGHRLDPDATRAALRSGVRALVLSSPHNPTGRVFSAAELEALAALAIAHDLLVVSDEVHADLVYPEHVHRPLAALGPEIAARTVTVVSAAKAFAIPGLRGAAAIYGSPALAAAADAFPHRLLGAPGALALEAMGVAWSGACDGWLDDVLRQLEANRRRVTRFAAATPGVAFAPPEGTFLAWLDLRGRGLAAGAADFLLRRARVSLRDGADYGAPGFVRMNFATPASNLEEILRRLAAALERAPSGA